MRMRQPNSFSRRLSPCPLVNGVARLRLHQQTKYQMAKAAVVVNGADTLRLHEKDTGSADVQIALLTKRISSLTEHLKGNSKDHASRRGLLKLVATRRSLLDYLKRTASSRYATVLATLELRK
jgi:small subunit ribosomal protein S15